MPIEISETIAGSIPVLREPFSLSSASEALRVFHLLEAMSRAVREGRDASFFGSEEVVGALMEAGCDGRLGGFPIHASKHIQTGALYFLIRPNQNSLHGESVAVTTRKVLDAAQPEFGASIVDRVADRQGEMNEFVTRLAANDFGLKSFDAEASVEKPQ